MEHSEPDPGGRRRPTLLARVPTLWPSHHQPHRPSGQPAPLRTGLSPSQAQASRPPTSQVQPLRVLVFSRDAPLWAPTCPHRSNLGHVTTACDVQRGVSWGLAAGCPDGTLFPGASGRASLDDLTWNRWTQPVDGPPRCGWASPSPLEAWVDQKVEEVGLLPLLLPHPSSWDVSSHLLRPSEWDLHRRLPGSQGFRPR